MEKTVSVHEGHLVHNSSLKILNISNSSVKCNKRNMYIFVYYQYKT
jgi:hypothetical protein